MEEWSLHVEVEIINIEQDGDIYIIDQLVHFVDNQRNYFDISKRKITVTISNHLIESVVVEFKPSPEEKAYMDLVSPIGEQFKP